eukprot:TRINITY_DN7242_c0_g1_i2.p1 TRINITY_DN7242_c0_g1~~TRINITY_DN7242_c0_g1_i2.p1  ORF type:complete len:135 (+),score=21.27 TRINITY_DN7242_c0_g1_i2:50-406(+)
MVCACLLSNPSMQDDPFPLPPPSSYDSWSDDDGVHDTMLLDGWPGSLELGWSTIILPFRFLYVLQAAMKMAKTATLTRRLLVLATKIKGVARVMTIIHDPSTSRHASMMNTESSLMRD